MRTTITDISSYQAGLKLSDLTGIDVVMAKCTEGTYYDDMYFETWRKEAPVARKYFMWYHFLTTEDAVAQVRQTGYHLNDTTLIGMLDVEPTTMPGGARSAPGVQHIINYVEAAHRQGLTVKLVYLPHWYWDQLGRPDLTPLVDMGLYLISSSYPGGYQYPGDNSSGWDPYGNMHPLIYQYTSTYPLGNQKLDMNAFRGTLTELETLLTLKGHTMSTPIPAKIRDKWPTIAGEFSGTYDDSTAIIWADAAARYTAQQIDNTNAYLSQLTSAVANVANRLDTLNSILGRIDTLTTRTDANQTALHDQIATLTAIVQGTQGGGQGGGSGPTADEVARAVVGLLAKDLGV